MTQDLSVLNHKFDNLTETVSEMRQNVKELTAAITKLTLIEERQLHAAEALERAFKAIESISDRLLKLEQYVPANKRMSVWLDRASWGAIGILLMYVLKKSGLM